MCSCSNEPITSWISWENTPPTNPLNLLANAMIGSAGTFDRIALPTVPVTPSPIVITANPKCSALGSDNLQRVADADQWNFSHQTASVVPTTPLPLQKVIFLRGGTDWQMAIDLDFGVAPMNDVHLTYRDNYGTRGDAQGTIPVIFWSGPISGAQILKVTLNPRAGRVNMAIGGKLGSTPTFFEMEWIIVP